MRYKIPVYSLSNVKLLLLEDEISKCNIFVFLSFFAGFLDSFFVDSDFLCYTSTKNLST